ncbi:hypothetical protein UlMin_036895 [Ulmus minor]
MNILSIFYWAFSILGKMIILVSPALVDALNMERLQMNFKRLSLSDIKIDIKRVPKKKELLVDVKKKWENNSWGRKLIVQKKRASLNDFDQFKLMLAKIKVLCVLQKIAKGPLLTTNKIVYFNMVRSIILSLFVLVI